MVLEFAELMATDHRSVDADLFARMRAYWNDGQIVELGTMIGIFVGVGRWFSVAEPAFGDQEWRA